VVAVAADGATRASVTNRGNELEDVLFLGTGQADGAVPAPRLGQSPSTDRPYARLTAKPPARFCTSAVESRSFLHRLRG